MYTRGNSSAPLGGLHLQRVVCYIFPLGLAARHGREREGKRDRTGAPRLSRMNTFYFALFSQLTSTLYLSELSQHNPHTHTAHFENPTLYILCLRVSSLFFFFFEKYTTFFIYIFLTATRNAIYFFFSLAICSSFEGVLCQTRREERLILKFCASAGH